MSLPHRSRLSRGTPGLTCWRSTRDSSCASWPAESRHSLGPACRVCTSIRSSSAGTRSIGSVAAHRSRSTCPPRAVSSRIASSDSTGVSCQPSVLIAGATNRPTGRCTRSTPSSCSSASASQVGEPIRQHRSSSGANSPGWESAQRDRSSAWPAGSASLPARARRWSWTCAYTLGSLRSIGSRACARRRGSSRRFAGMVSWLQPSPASRSAAAWPATSAFTAAMLSRPELKVVSPWRRSTACVWASRLVHTSGSLTSTGSLAASRTSARRLRCSNARAQRGKQRCSWRAASVPRAWAMRRSRSSCS